MKDTCDANWPVCDGVAGCILGPESYVEGRFPDRARVIVQLDEPSSVRLELFLEEISSDGDETAVVFHEEGCRSRVRQAKDGRAVVDAMETKGRYSVEQELTGVGDHLVEYISDMQARYVLKVSARPLRNP